MCYADDGTRRFYSYLGNRLTNYATPRIIYLIAW